MSNFCRLHWQFRMVFTGVFLCLWMDCLVCRSVDLNWLVFHGFRIPGEAIIYMFNVVLCIHLYLLLLLLSTWRTQDPFDICSIFVCSLRFQWCFISFFISLRLFSSFFFFCCYCCHVTGSTFNLMSPNRLLLYRIYSHWIKSLLLLAINKYHSITTRNESNEMT